MGKLSASNEDLRRLVASEWWEWMPRMLIRDESSGRVEMIFGTSPDGVLVDRHEWWAVDPTVHPVVSDPATAGCLLELYLRQGDDPHMAFLLLGQDMPGLDGYATFGDFMVAKLLDL